MGEYARRKRDGVEVKIGTCSDMYYIRYEDRDKVARLQNSLDCSVEFNLRWRLPFPDEDKVKIGEYEDYCRGCGLSGFNDYDGMIDNVGTLQLTHESGLLINVPCYHGIKLPDITGPKVGAFWNGKSNHIELSSVKNMPDGTLRPVIRCRYCGESWRSEWEYVLPHLYDRELKERLEVYAAKAVSL